MAGKNGLGGGELAINKLAVRYGSDAHQELLSLACHPIESIGDRPRHWYGGPTRTKRAVMDGIKLGSYLTEHRTPTMPLHTAARALHIHVRNGHDGVCDAARAEYDSRAVSR